MVHGVFLAEVYLFIVGIVVGVAGGFSGLSKVFPNYVVFCAVHAVRDAAFLEGLHDDLWV